jgi:hypothetical protein
MNPVLIGAGIGALGSAVQGKSPLTGALLGGATGGLFGGSESLLGGKIAGAFGQGAAGGVTNGINLSQVGTNVGGTALGVGSQGITNIAQFAKPLTGIADDAVIGASLADDVGIAASNIPSTNIPLSVSDLRGGVGKDLLTSDMSKLFNYTDPTMMDKVQGFGNDAFSWAKNNPTSAGGFAVKGIEAINTPPEKVNTSAQQPVRQGQFQGYTPTAAPSRVAPQIVPVPINKTGMLQLDTVVAQNPELRKLYPDLFGG